MKVRVLNVVDDKTASVLATSYGKHARSGKYIVTQKKYLVDSGGHKLAVDNEVEISSCRPISRRKRWVVSSLHSPKA